MLKIFELHEMLRNAVIPFKFYVDCSDGDTYYIIYFEKFSSGINGKVYQNVGSFPGYCIDSLLLECSGDLENYTYTSYPKPLYDEICKKYKAYKESKNKDKESKKNKTEDTPDDAFSSPITISVSTKNNKEYSTIDFGNISTKSDLKAVTNDLNELFFN